MPLLIVLLLLSPFYLLISNGYDIKEYFEDLLEEESRPELSLVVLFLIGIIGFAGTICIFHK